MPKLSNGNGRKGKTIPRIFETNHGLRAAWFESWYPKPDDEYCIIIEDDLEVSPFWYTWLKKAWLNYGDRTDMAGIALQASLMGIAIRVVEFSNGGSKIRKVFA